MSKSLTIVERIENLFILNKINGLKVKSQKIVKRNLYWCDLCGDVIKVRPEYRYIIATNNYKFCSHVDLSICEFKLSLKI